MAVRSVIALPFSLSGGSLSEARTEPCQRMAKALYKTQQKRAGKPFRAVKRTAEQNALARLSKLQRVNGSSKHAAPQLGRPQKRVFYPQRTNKGRNGRFVRRKREKRSVAVSAHPASKPFCVKWNASCGGGAFGRAVYSYVKAIQKSTQKGRNQAK